MTQSEEIQFNEVYESLFPKMVNFAGRLCGNKEEAEDITQEAFVKAYRSFDKCDSRFRIDNWLMRIVYNTFLDHKRRQRRRATEVDPTLLGADFSVEDFEDTSLMPDTNIFKSAMNPTLKKALRELDRESQELLHLAYVEQLDHVEIGKRFQVKPGAVRSRLHRVCQKLRRTLGTNKQFEMNASGRFILDF